MQFRLPRELEFASAFEVLPGVLSLLSELSMRDDVVLGLGTGNTEPAAFAKLARGGLDSFFTFGGFGSDHTDRAELLRTGGYDGAALEAAGASVVVSDLRSTAVRSAFDRSAAEDM